jgi:hypothetical protein
MDPSIVDGFFTLAGVAVTVYTFFGTIVRLANLAASLTRKIVLGVALFGIWAAAQMGAFLLVLVLSYCENCSAKPVLLRDVLMYLILLSPSCVAFIILRTTSPRKHDVAC